MPELAEQIQGMLAEIKGQLETTTEDGQVIKILDVFKMFPALQEKYIALEKRLEDMEKKARERKYTGIPGLELECDKFSLVRAIKYIKSGKLLDNWPKEAGFEAEVFRNTAKLRTLGTQDDEGAGYLVPAQAMPEFIEMLRAEAVTIRMGARVISGLTGAPVTFVKQTGGATAYWVGEGTAPTASDLTTGLIKMTPKKIMALTYINNELIRMSNPGAEGLVRQDLAIVLGLAMDLAILRGSGSVNQPLGIANTTGINTVALGTNGDTPDWVNPWPDMEYELAVDNALRGRLGFVFHPAIKKVLKKLRNPYFSGDSGGEYPLLPLSDAQIEGAIGYPFGTTTQLPINLTKGDATNCSEIYFGNWLEVLIGEWLGLEIMASNVAGTAFATDQTWIRIISQIDAALRHSESMCLCNDAKIA